jgi:hypothetical protein
MRARPEDRRDCPECGGIAFAGWVSCPTCRRLRRRRQIADSQRKRRREKRYQAARIDRVADLRRRVRNGQILPIVVLHVRGHTYWLVTSRRHQPVPVAPAVVETVFANAPKAFEVYPARGTLLFATRAPYAIRNYPLVMCRKGHRGATVRLELEKVLPPSDAATGDGTTEVSPLLNPLPFRTSESLDKGRPYGPLFDADRPCQMVEVFGCAQCTSSMENVRFCVRLSRPTASRDMGLTFPPTASHGDDRHA